MKKLVKRILLVSSMTVIFFSVVLFFVLRQIDFSPRFLMAKPVGKPVAKIINNGVVGNFYLKVGNCMPGPGAPRDCVKKVTGEYDLYFVDVDSLESYKVTTHSDGNFSLELENGLYYVIADAGWDQGQYSQACLTNTSLCSSEELQRIISQIDYSRRFSEICDSEIENMGLQKTRNCLVRIQDNVMYLTIPLDNVAM